MSLLKELLKEEEYRLFKVSSKGVEEVDLDDILNDPEGFEDDLSDETGEDELDSEPDDEDLDFEDLDSEDTDELDTEDGNGEEIDNQFDLDFGAPAEYMDVDDFDFEIGNDDESKPYGLDSENDDDNSYNLYSPSYNKSQQSNLAVNNNTGMDGAEELDDTDFDDETDGELNWDKDLEGMEMAPDHTGRNDEDEEDFDDDENHYGDDPSLLTHDKPSDFGPGGSLSRYQTDDFADSYFKDLPGDGLDDYESTDDEDDKNDVNIDDEDDATRLDTSDSDLEMGFGDDESDDDSEEEGEDEIIDNFGFNSDSDESDESDEDDFDEEEFDDDFDDEDESDEDDFNLDGGNTTGDVDFDEDDDFDEDNDDFDDDDNGSDSEDQEDSDGEDPNFQGVIRTVKGSVLVYKRQEQDGTYTELWAYTRGNDNNKDIKEDMRVRRAILAGTDIDSSTQMSEDGQQEVDTTSMGNVVFVKITGLPQ